MRTPFVLVAYICFLFVGCSNFRHGSIDERPAPESRAWLAGDHHVHSEYSVDWDKTVDPPVPRIGREGKYSAKLNAQQGQYYGLSWIVITNHGGPDQSSLNRQQAYPQLVESRQLVPEVLQFYGMELDTPGAKHSTVIMPRTDNEADRMLHLEKSFGRKETFPDDLTRDKEERMLDALATMQELPEQPIMLANHPARSATGLGVYGLVAPRQLRDWHDAAPTVMIGMEGSPGHQASSLMVDGSIDADGLRGDYDDYPTMGGFDQMAARLGGLWDSMLGEGRRWWITSTSDSHIHYSEGGEDFWPGEYSKTYVYAERTYDGIMQGLRNGNIFVSAGDLVSELYVKAEMIGGERNASIGETLHIAKGSDVRITVKFLDPKDVNAHGGNPDVSRIDVITGLITEARTDRNRDINSTTVVAERFTPESWRRVGDYSLVTYEIPDMSQSAYVRVRGTSGNELEPQPDPPGEDPWADLWFYSNPIFIVVD